MGLRFIDTDLINKRWFRELSPEWKMLWIQMTLMCDHAGILDVDIPMWNVRIGDDIRFTEEEILKVFSDKIYAYKKDKWWLVDYIDFQQKSNNIRSAIKKGTNNLFYKFIINRLEIEGLTRVFLDPPSDPPLASAEGQGKGPSTSISNSKVIELSSEDKAKEKKAEKKLRLKRNKDQFELIWSEYPKKREKKPGLEKYLVMAPDEDLFNLIYADITERAKSHDWRKEDSKYVPLMTTYLNQERWNDEMFAVDAPAQERNSGRGPYIEDEEDD